MGTVPNIFLRSILISSLFFLTPTSQAQDSPTNIKGQTSESSLASIARCNTKHTIGNLGLAVSNTGNFGVGFDGYSSGRSKDCFTGERLTSCEFPQGSGTQYLFGGTIWIGAVVGKDTLVTTGADGWGGGGIKHSLDNDGYIWRNLEFYPDDYPQGSMIRRSTMNPLSPAFQDAVSEEDIISHFTDTVTTNFARYRYDQFEVRPHQPLNISVTQSSYAWSYTYADDFILVNFDIENFGDSILKQTYFGLYMDGDVWGDGNRDRGIGDDITGFRETHTYTFNDCEFTDTLSLAWLADNDGDFGKRTPVTGALGTRFLRAPNSTHKSISYNWWTSNNKSSLDFGPRHLDTPEHPFWDLRTGGLGTPEGDRSKYAFLSNHEHDYDQIRMLEISSNDTAWIYPNRVLANYIPRGYDVGYLQSVGPFNIRPQEKLTVTVAFVSEPNFHLTARHFQKTLQTGTYKPDEYMAGLGWSSFEEKTKWAGWVYDNPGVDTDGDGYFGRYHLCCSDSVEVIDESDTSWEYTSCDTLWYEGDLTADFQGASPPPAPKVWVAATTGQIHVRWNGLRSETTADVFSRQIDFDGYRVYLARDSRPGSFTMLASYDLENYLLWLFDWDLNKFVLKEDPFSAEQLDCMFGESCDDPTFDPRDFPRTNPLVFGDSLVYFEHQDFNRSEFGVSTPINKIYPGTPKPPYSDPVQVPAWENDLYLTEDGYFKYYEYEYTIENLLPTVSYFVNVTSFDYGSPKSGLGSLETSLGLNSIEVYPLPSAEQVAEEDLKVYIYPNPYRIDGGYLEDGFEGRDAQFYIPERMRLIHFVNLPPKCRISVFSLDGDLIKEFDHDRSPTDPLASQDEFDLISRNTQTIVTGIYYWVVEAAGQETQIGKLIIMR